MKIFYNSTESTWDVYMKTRAGLRKVASFTEHAEALQFMSKGVN